MIGRLLLSLARVCAALSLTAGVVVLASSQADQFSWDIDGYMLKGNMLYTRVLFEALSGKADTDGDGVITLAELDAYMTKHVPALAEQRKYEQTPCFEYGGLAPETPFAKLPKKAEEDFVPPPPPEFKLNAR